MGKNKAEMEICGKTLLERTLEIMEPVVNKMVVMLNPTQAEPVVRGTVANMISFGRDSRQKQGPLQGIADALPLLPEQIENIFVVTCDLPYLTEEWLISMKEAFTEDVDVVHAVDDGITNPLLALYRKKVLWRANDLLADNQRRPIRLWDGFRLVGMSPPPDDPMVCKDINTPEEFQQAKRALSTPCS